jgi:hypothetical protein
MILRGDQPVWQAGFERARLVDADSAQSVFPQNRPITLYPGGFCRELLCYEDFTEDIYS